MTNPKNYKYLKPYTKDGVVYAIVVKPVHWIDRPNEVVEALPVGAITWFAKSYIKIDEKGDPIFHKGSVHPERNRYSANCDSSSFELLHTSKQKLKRRYRINTS